MSTYANMQARIADEVQDTGSALTSQIQKAILSAIAHYERERWHFTETSTTFVTVASTQTYALPTDFKAMQRVRLTATSGTFWEIDPESFDYVNKITTVPTILGPPQIYATYDELIWLWPIPDQVYTVTEYYEQTLAALSADTDSNSWTNEAEELIRSRAKWDLYINVIQNADGNANAAGEQKQIEQEAYSQLRAASTTRSIRGIIAPVYL